MITEYTDKFIEARPQVEAAIRANPPADYKSIVKLVIETVTREGEYSDPDPERIHEIDDGDYQGTLVYVIGAKGYQPDRYWYARVGYGSCSGCDTLEAIRGYRDEPPTDEQVREYWTLALNVAQGLREIGRRRSMTTQPNALRALAEGMRLHHSYTISPSRIWSWAERIESAISEHGGVGEAVALARGITRDPERFASHVELLEAGILQIVGDSAAISQAVKLIRGGGSGYRTTPPTPSAEAFDGLPFRNVLPRIANDYEEWGNKAMADYLREQASKMPPTPSAPVVDDAMVERAWMALTGRDKLGGAYADDAKCMMPEERRNMRDALTAALSGVNAPVGVEEYRGSPVDDLRENLHFLAELASRSDPNAALHFVSKIKGALVEDQRLRALTPATAPRVEEGPKWTNPAPHAAPGGLAAGFAYLNAPQIVPAATDEGAQP